MKFLLSCVVLLALSGCVGDWSQRAQDAAPYDGTEAEEAGVERRVAQPDAASPDASETSDAGPGQDADAQAELDADQTHPDAELASESGPTDAGSGAATDASGDAETPRSAAIATPDTPCSVNVELACSAHNAAQKLACVNGKWTFTGSCDGPTRCDTRFGVTQGTCQAITQHCLGKTPGAAVCDGPTRMSCGLDLLDEIPMPCDAHAHCEGTAPNCVCDAGFMSSTSGCVDIPDCPAGGCANGSCIEATESYSCSCNSGYRLAPDQHSCVDIPDCTPGICALGGTCTEGLNNYECTCASGYEKKPGEKKCSNIDNCVGSPCGPGTCTDGLNAYACQCAEGYVAVGLESSPTCVPYCEAYCCDSCCLSGTPCW
jgi:hypothetical protein